MFSKIINTFRAALCLFVLLSIITGLIYPFLITGIGQLAFKDKANGSMIVENDKVIGSSLIGQPFDSMNYFWGRPSATTPYPYNADASSASNLGPTNQDYLKLVKTRIAALEKANPNAQAPVPVDLVTASGSGLDPDISPAAAYYQVPRVAKARHLSINAVEQLVSSQITPRQWGIFGEPRVNVLQLNLALDKLK